MTAGDGAKTKQCVRGGRLEGKDMWDPQEMGAGLGQDRLPQMFCCRVLNETVELDLGEEGDKRKVCRKLI